MLILKPRHKIFGHLAAHFHRLWYIGVTIHSDQIISCKECVKVTGTVSGHLRSSVSCVRSVHKDDMECQHHLLDGFWMVQVISLFCHC